MFAETYDPEEDDEKEERVRLYVPFYMVLICITFTLICRKLIHVCLLKLDYTSKV